MGEIGGCEVPGWVPAAVDGGVQVTVPVLWGCGVEVVGAAGSGVFFGAARVVIRGRMGPVRVGLWVRRLKGVSGL